MLCHCQQIFWKEKQTTFHAMSKISHLFLSLNSQYNFTFYLAFKIYSSLTNIGQIILEILITVEVFKDAWPCFWKLIFYCLGIILKDDHSRGLNF